jgi:predicted membrane protein
MSSPISKLIYNISFVSGVINFPWRFLEITTLASSMAGGLVIEVIRRQTLEVRRKQNKITSTSWQIAGITRLLVGLIIIFVVIFNWNEAQILSSRFSYSDSFYAKTYLTNNKTYFDTEYMPVWANYFGVLENKGVAWDKSFFQSKEKINVKDFQKNKLTYLATIETNNQTTIQAQQFYFPGWRAWIDNQGVKVSPDEFGLVSFSVPSGSHNIKVEFTDTLIRKIGNCITLTSIFGIVVFILTKRIFCHIIK